MTFSKDVSTLIDKVATRTPKRLLNEKYGYPISRYRVQIQISSPGLDTLRRLRKINDLYPTRG